MNPILPKKDPNYILIGYCLSLDYNKHDMFDRDDMSIPRCPLCKIRLNYLKTNPDFTMLKRSKSLNYRDVVSKEVILTCTYDIKNIATLMLKEFCENQKYEALKFESFTNDPWHFHLIAENTIPFDKTRCGIRFLDKCPRCDRYESVVGEFNFYLVREPLKDGFYSGDLLLGSEDRRGQRIIVGIETREKLNALNLKGIYFRPVYGNVYNGVI